MSKIRGITMNTLADVQYTGGYHEYSGDTVSTPGVFSTPGGPHCV